MKAFAAKAKARGLSVLRMVGVVAFFEKGYIEFVCRCFLWFIQGDAMFLLLLLCFRWFMWFLWFIDVYRDMRLKRDTKGY